LAACRPTEARLTPLLPPEAGVRSSALKMNLNQAAVNVRSVTFASATPERSDRNLRRLLVLEPLSFHPPLEPPHEPAPHCGGQTLRYRCLDPWASGLYRLDYTKHKSLRMLKAAVGIAIKLAAVIITGVLHIGWE
jgi:hypothetical protein